MTDLNSIQSYSLRLSILLCVKALAMVAVILFLGVGLGPDEAQYWTWSRDLDWGYYSKPPGIAWQIWLGTQIFGQTEWGVRSLVVLLAFFQARIVYLLALRTVLSAQTAFWSSLLMAFTPLGILGSLFAVTDVGFLLCWTGACLTVVSALDKKRAPNPLFIGAWILFGALFKWPMYLFWVFYFCSLYWYFPRQKKSSVICGVLFSLLGLLPSVWWNATHDWVTFRHVSATVQGGNAHHSGGNFASFFGSQAALLSPIIFGLLILALLNWFKKRRELSPPLFFCGFLTFIVLGGMGIVSCFQKIQGNWIVFAYPTGIVLLGWYAFELFPQRALWVKIGLALSVFLMAITLLLPSLYTDQALSSYAFGYQKNPLKHNLGWNALREVLITAGYRPEKNFLVSDKYQTASILSFYGTGQKRAYFLNLQGSRRNQFSYWPSLQEEQKGQTGFFVWVENVPYLEKEWKDKLIFYRTELARYFERVEFLIFAPLVYEGPKIVKAAAIFRCEKCKNTVPEDSSFY